MGIFSCKTKRRRALVMNFVDILVEETSIEKNATSHQGQLRRCSQGTYPSSERNPPRRKIINSEEPQPSTRGRALARLPCREFQRRGGTARSSKIIYKTIESTGKTNSRLEALP